MSVAKMGMLAFLLSEIGFFGTLIVGYVALHHASPGSEAAERSLAVGKTAIYTVLLLASSATIVLAERAEHRASSRGVRAWLAATIALGVAFLIGQGLEYADLLAHNITISSNLFATSFFTLTGFHGLHVCAGLIMLGTLLGLDFQPRFGRVRGDALGTISYYWHFVDVVWIAVFTVVYLGMFL